VWGVVHGILDSTVKAVVSTLVEPPARALAFGWLSVVRGLGLLVAGAALGAAYDHGVGLTMGLIVAVNLAAFVALARVVRATNA
jgi:hypothetical protein